ncbi:hypothetical protein [Pseudonocardia xishanensis]|uniref:Uncharacterized protein n=1 Tax=Pseudonocardia xishanensis TaxID=630995 RepID=A0ABP8RTV0_9PSEU
MSESSGGVTAELLTCELPGCTNVMEYSGVGRKPKYCGQTVDGVPHTRLTAHKVANGQLTLPAPGSRGGTDGETANTRPVSLARMTMEALRDEVATTIGDHEQRMSGLLARFGDALASATDPDAAHAEVTAAHREARAQVDAAEAARDRAVTAARTAVAETEAERDRSRADLVRVTEELEDTQSLLAERDTELEQARQEFYAARGEGERLQMELTGAKAEIEHLERRLGEEQQERAELSRRTDVAEQRADRMDRANQT